MQSFVELNTVFSDNEESGIEPYSLVLCSVKQNGTKDVASSLCLREVLIVCRI